MDENHYTLPFYRSLRVFGWVVLFLMLASIFYSGWISISNWAGISV